MYLVAKIGYDTADHGPLFVNRFDKTWQHSANSQHSAQHFVPPLPGRLAARVARDGYRGLAGGPEPGEHPGGGDQAPLRTERSSDELQVRADV